ncbi:MAG: FGGY-family carbohydrate kinase [Bacteroides sp.]|nr:FGGY-family carbohydrate kinase [Prevotella sp.]MCM1407768.1 FGGY-family carbohydrate kinase [Treponema brennaborense]MCM1468884.1 FGGY-family carbohydrate kinase [Bacteroides sp.]
MTENPIVLCIDIGTSFLKAALIRGNGNVLAFSKTRINTALGLSMWYEALKESCGNLFCEPADIAAVSISGNGPTLITNSAVHFWNEPLSVSYEGKSLFLPRLLQIKQHAAAEWDASRYIFSGQDFLIFQLTNTAATVLPEKRYVPYYWTEADCALYGIPKDKLPPFADAGEIIGYATKTAAADLHLPEHKKIPVFSAGPDFAAALIGTDTLHPGASYDRAGTSEGINLCTSLPIHEDGIRTLPSLCGNCFNASVIIPDTGLSFQRYKQHSKYADVSDSECVHALLAHPERDDIRILYRIAFKIKQAVEALQTAAEKYGTPKITTLRAAGGQAKNREWLQMKCDILNIPIEIPECIDAELLGCFITAQKGMGMYGSIEEAAKMCLRIQTTLYPSQKKNEYYTNLFRSQSKSR